jgi:aspartyl-tRNA(Asn)/glutamyl-tRNA(Gln) amidotransferase subunit A
MGFSSLNLQSMDLSQVAQSIRNKEFSCTEVTLWCLQRLETIGKPLNAVFSVHKEEAISRAKYLDQKLAQGVLLGPLHGVPLAHKELFGIKGRECHAGSLIYKDHIAKETAWVLQQLDTSGQVNLGSLHMAELALSPTGFNQHYPHPQNPWNRDYVPGGSSSGSGVAVAARLVFGSLGSDTGGSIRHPSAMCGVTGLKPTQGLISVRGVFPLSATLDCVGPIAQSARDCALLLDAIAKFDADDPLSNRRDRLESPSYFDSLSSESGRSLKDIKIGIPEDYYRCMLDIEVQRDLNNSLDVLRSLGATIKKTKVPDMARINTMMQRVMSSEASTLHLSALKQTPELIAQQVRLRLEPGLSYSANEYLEAIGLQKILRDEYIHLAFGDCDLIHIPSLIVQTPRIDETTRGSASEVLESLSKLTHATRAINYLGLPAISLPIGMTSLKMPTSMQLVARSFGEALLLRVGHAYQEVTDWHRQMPELCF